MPGIFENLDFSKIMENPEALAIGLDMMGQSIGGPTTPFGGVGTFMGQSSLAGKALKEQRQEQIDFRKLVTDILSGNVPITATGESGISGATIKPGKEGGSPELSFQVTEPTDVKKRETEYKSLSDYMSNPNF